MTLPAELHLELLSTLDYRSLMSFTGTNHYFASLRTNDLVRKALRHFERSLVQKMAIRPASATTDNEWGFYGARVTRMINFHLPPLNYPSLPCYDCLKLRKRESHFRKFFTTGESDLDGILASGRKCSNYLLVRQWLFCCGAVEERFGRLSLTEQPDSVSTEQSQSPADAEATELSLVLETERDSIKCQCRPYCSGILREDRFRVSRSVCAED